MPMPMVQLKEVTKRYGSVTAVQPTSLDIARGEFVTLLGPSGSGKTTLLNIIAGMTPPTQGEVWIDGRDVSDVPSAKRGLGMVFQSYALMPHMTVFQNIAFPLQIRKLPRNEIRHKVHEVLELVQLAHVADRKPRELSGGQQQRISLARCVVYSPPLILMDEPLGALDKKLREQMQVEIKRLHTHLGITMLYVTHDQEEALTMSDRIILMNNARVEQIGAPHELYFQPATVFAADFIGHSNLIEGTLTGRESLQLRSGHLMRVPHVPDIPCGTAVRLLIRPENVRIAAPDTANGGGLQGKVVSSLFSGSTVKHYVDIGAPAPVIVQQALHSGDPLPAAGTPVCLSWAERDCRVLRA